MSWEPRALSSALGPGPDFLKGDFLSGLVPSQL